MPKIASAEAINIAEPVFVHSLWRTGSTYVFDVFRRSESGYFCYQEPIHEFVLQKENHPASLLDVGAGASELLRHPKLDRPYMQEIYETHNFWKGIITKSMIYDEYFCEENSPALSAYLSALIAGAHGRPVIQECRTSNRIGAIKKACGGKHLYLWRNPRDQWWSFKATSYFDAVVQMILNTRHHPAAIANLREQIGFLEVHHDDIAHEIFHFELRPLSATDSYLSFFMIWALGWLSGQAHSDIDINMDHMSNVEAYREQKLDELARIGIDGVDFSDCHIPNTSFDENDLSFFRPIERRAYSLLRRSGVSPKDIANLQNARRRYAPTADGREPTALDALRARQIALRLTDEATQRAQHFDLYLRQREADWQNEKGIYEKQRTELEKRLDDERLAAAEALEIVRNNTEEQVAALCVDQEAGIASWEERLSLATQALKDAKRETVEEMAALHVAHDINVARWREELRLSNEARDEAGRSALARESELRDLLFAELRAASACIAAANTAFGEAERRQEDAIALLRAEGVLRLDQEKAWHQREVAWLQEQESRDTRASGQAAMLQAALAAEQTRASELVAMLHVARASEKAMREHVTASLVWRFAVALRLAKALPGSANSEAKHG
jgi:hypothetical protein